MRPPDFNRDLVSTVKTLLHLKYCGRVVFGVGLGVAIWDIVHIEDPYVFPGEASTSMKVVFRLIVFRPRVGEVMVGEVEHQPSAGVQLGIEFFHDFKVPAKMLSIPSRWAKDPDDPKQHIWYWAWQNQVAWMEYGQMARARITDVVFHSEPPAKLNTSNFRQPCMEVFGSFRAVDTSSSEGLGMVMWWDQGDDEEEDGEAE